MKRKKPLAHLVGNAHIDPVWLWNREEGVEVVLATFRQSIDLIKKHPEYTFTASSALFYRWVEEVDSELFRKIRKAVKNGRWFLVGGSWVESDLNIPSGESLVRQELYGQRYFWNKFGVVARVGYNPDGFGHNGMLPQILKKSGLDCYVFTKPVEPDQPLPGLFSWEGYDGSRLTAFKITGPGLYSTWLDKEIEEKIRLAEKMAVDQTMIFFGGGDHGYGTTVQELELIDGLKKEPGRVEFKYSSPEGFFRSGVAKTKKIPVFRGEIQHYARGCYSSCSELKELNRRVEHLLLAAEKISVAAGWSVGYRYPKKRLDYIWQDLLFCQFHDILAGTSIFEACDDAKQTLGGAVAQAREIINSAFQRLCQKIDTRHKDRLPLVIFNTHAWPVRAAVEFEHLNYRPASDSKKEESFDFQAGERKKIFNNVYEENSKAVIFQEIKTSGMALPGQKRLVFVADLPALGYRTYLLGQGEDRSSAANDMAGLLKINGTILENRWFKIDISRKTGYLDSFFDLKNQLEVLSGPAGVPIVLRDESDAWGHGRDEYREKIGCFQKTAIEVVERGPVRTVARVGYRFNESRLYQDFILYRDLKFLESKLLIDWREKHRILKFCFPVKLKNPKATYQTAYGFTERPVDGKEEPGHQWFDVTGQTTNSRGNEVEYGLTVANNGRYSFDVKDAEMRITVLRSAVFAHGDFAGAKLNPSHLYRYMDQGIHAFSYRLFPHAGPLHKGKASRLADEFNFHPLLLVHHNHSGSLPLTDSFVKSDAKNVITTVLKESEDNRGLILRCYETEGRTGRVKISLPKLNLSWQARLKPFEVKTYLIPDKKKSMVKEVNLIEM